MRYLNLLSEKYQALSVREKWLIAIGVSASLIMLIQTLFIAPVVEEANRKERQLSTEQQKIQRQKSDIDILKLRLKVDPDKEIDEKLARLSEHSLELSQQLAELIDSLITPQQMTDLLETVLGSSSKLKLEALESLPAEAVFATKQESAQQQDNDESQQAVIGYYIHPVRIELTGRYFDIQDYLKKLEAMPVKYYWRSFQYQVETYPEARLVLEVYTLGTRQEFIGG
ncbi:type II secretion system protein GspM [Vibrio albus]|nr:type II secretion system protein GspM [Vibrio albus]